MNLVFALHAAKRLQFTLNNGGVRCPARDVHVSAALEALKALVSAEHDVFIAWPLVGL